MIGGKNNTYSSIFRNNKECLEEIHTPDVLWPDQFRKFTIQVTHGMFVSTWQINNFDEFRIFTKKKFLSNISAGYVRVYVAPFNELLMEAINLQPIYINYVLFSAIKCDNSSIEYYFDCGKNAENAAPKMLTDAQNIPKGTASQHTHTITFVMNIFFTALAVQSLLIVRIRWLWKLCIFEHIISFEINRKTKNIFVCALLIYSLSYSAGMCVCLPSKGKSYSL